MIVTAGPARVKRLVVCAAFLTCGCAAAARPFAGIRSPADRQIAVERCTLPARDSAWLVRAIDAWELTRERYLTLPPQPLPRLVLFDRRCVFHVLVEDAAPGIGQQARAADAKALMVAGTEHAGTIDLPNGHVIGARPIGMTSPHQGDSALFVVLALTDVWRTDPSYRNQRENWDHYLTGAFIHEMTHARMLPALLPRLRAMEPAMFPDSIRDDAVQDRFASDPLFTASLTREIQLLYRAVHARSRGARAELAQSALDLLRTRRARFYTGDLEAWWAIEDVFLDLEGVAQWAAFSHARDTYFRRMSLSEAMDRFRYGEQYWSQDQGLALLLTLDALDPEWRRRFFAPSARRSSAVELLARALESR